MLVLVGSGPMARDHAKVLQAQNVPFIVVGRGDANAAAFEESIGTPVLRGGLAAAISSGTLKHCTHAIVAVGVEALFDTSSQLIEAGITRLLVEKPAGLTATEIVCLNELALATNASVFVAYNRRFYSSVLHAQKMLEVDGGVKSFVFEFTEWGHEIVTLKKAPGVKEQWLLGNSSHVLDLAFFLGGKPSEMHTHHAGSLDWHPRVAVFAGSGRTKHGALFSYHANWDAPGRWSLEFCSNNYRLIFRPMESLQLVRRGSVAIEPVEVEGAQLDKDFKPGLYLQTKAFLQDDTSSLCTLTEHVSNLQAYVDIGRYGLA